MILIGVTEIILIVVSVLLLACIIGISVLLLNKKRKSKNRTTEGNFYAASQNFSDVRNAEQAQAFTVIGTHNEQKGRVNNSFANEPKGSNTVSIGGGLTGNNHFGYNSDSDDKTEILFGNGSPSSNRSSDSRASGFPGSIIVQYQKHGTLQKFNLSEPCAVIGRDRSCDILVDSDTYMSEYHAILLVRNGALFIADLSSKNGTFVNDRPVKGMVNLSGKEKIRVASTEIKIVFN